MFSENTSLVPILNTTSACQTKSLHRLIASFHNLLIHVSNTSGNNMAEDENDCTGQSLLLQ